MCAEHFLPSAVRRINRELSMINLGNNLYNIRPEVINDIPNISVILGSITVPVDAANIDNAGNTFQIRIQLPENYALNSPKIFVNNEEYGFIDAMGYNIHLYMTGQVNELWNSPVINYNFDRYFAGEYEVDHNGWNEWSPAISLETTFKILQYMLGRNELPPNQPGPNNRCNIDFTIIPTLSPHEVADLDLSQERDPITQQEFIPGEEYYRVIKVIPSVHQRQPTRNVIYCDKEILETWLNMPEHSRCLHPVLRNVFINQQDISRFVYTGPKPETGGSRMKRKSRTLKQKNRKSKSNK
jgi:ubiquitin-protein ligase